MPTEITLENFAPDHTHVYQSRYLGNCRIDVRFPYGMRSYGPSDISIGAICGFHEEYRERVAALLYNIAAATFALRLHGSVHRR